MQPGITIIHRVDISAISEIEEDGKLEFLGEQRDFRRHPLLAAFLGEFARLGVAWVRLGPGQILASHRHPIRSMILVCSGRGVVFDEDGERPLAEGDAVLVSQNYLHGFRGADPEGVSGLSIQFEERGLYEDTQRPLVKFAR